MPQYVPDSIYFYEADEDNMIQALLNNIVVSGCSVAERSPQIMGVRVAAGVIFGDGLRVAVSQTDLVVGANSSGSNRLDLVSVNKATGVPTITAGTPAGTPIPPSLPLTDLLLAYINVANNAANIQAANITDRRLQIPWRLGTMTFANLPAVGKAGQLALTSDVDTPELVRDDGAAWRTIGSRYPNLCLNSDFGRRTVFGLAMPEAFSVITGWTAVVNTVGTVAANILTSNATQSERKAGIPSWSDGRFSAQFKATQLAGDAWFGKGVDANNKVTARYTNGTFFLEKVIAGTPTAVASVAQALTLNNWYWLELEAQGQKYTATLYSSGAAPTTKAAATVLQTLTGTVADAAVATGSAYMLDSMNPATQWGGVAASPGGVYVETWLPESWSVSFAGTLGSQAIGFDEAADSGPLTKQWTPVVVIPQATSTVTAQYDGPDGGMLAASAYTASYYEKNTGLGGSGVMVRGSFLEQNSAQATQATTNIDDAAEAAYTRKSASVTTNAATRRFRFQFIINPATTRTGTVRFSLPQVEQGSTATAWRPAPADDGQPITWDVQRLTGNVTLTATTTTEVDSRDLAVNIFLPWDATVDVAPQATVTEDTVGQYVFINCTVDGVAFTPGDMAYQRTAVANSASTLSPHRRIRLAAGKHRIAMIGYRSATGSGTIDGVSTSIGLTITATRGK